MVPSWNFQLRTKDWHSHCEWYVVEISSTKNISIMIQPWPWIFRMTSVTLKMMIIMMMGPWWGWWWSFCKTCVCCKCWEKGGWKRPRRGVSTSPSSSSRVHRHQSNHRHHLYHPQHRHQFLVQDQQKRQHLLFINHHQHGRGCHQHSTVNNKHGRPNHY